MEVVIGKVLGVFEEISAVPRCSKKEEKISQWLTDWASAHKFDHKRDKAGNVLVKVPGTLGYENSSSVVLQGHMDMVCVKESTSRHDFDKDPIKVIRKGDWLQADGTTLGADNGIALAMALYLATTDLPHPPLELLFTVDEETGLTGVRSIEEGFIESKLLINIDSEDEGKFTIGCAGGRDVEIKLPLQFEPAPENSSFLEIKIGGLQGGHSGVDIDKFRANAIKLVSRALYRLKERFSFNLINLEGGTAHNAISSNAKASICCFGEDIEEIKIELEKFRKDALKEYHNVEDGITVQALEIGSSDQVFTEESTEEAINLVLALPHGIAAMTPDIPDLVETSDNLAKVKIRKDELEILVSIRSSLGSRLEALTNRITAISDLAGATAYAGEGYPAWEPDTESVLLKKSVAVYDELFGKKAKIMIIHAGLECAVFAKKFPELDMISIGPTILSPHSPQERLNLPSLEKTWQFLVKLLEEMK